MNNNILETIKNYELGFKTVKIKGIYDIDDYFYITFDNNQKILINKENKKIYDISNYGSFEKVYIMNGKKCAYLKGYTTYLVDLDKDEILFEDEYVEYISKEDEKMLHVIKKGSHNNLYNIETKKYLPVPKNYEFEHSLGNNLYVFKDQNREKPFYETKRCVINSNGETLLKDAEGWIELDNNNLIIIKENVISIMSINNNSTLNIKTIKKENDIIARPYYYDHNIIVIEKNVIKIFNSNLELLKEIKIDGLEEVIDLEFVDDTLKLCIPATENENKLNKHLYINLKTGNTIYHTRIEGYPYWEPTTYVGFDILEDKQKSHHFYDKNFNKITTIEASYYDSIDTNENIFFVISENDEKKYLLNTEIHKIKEVDYDIVEYINTSSHICGVNYTTRKMDFLDEEFNAVIKNFNFEKYDLILNANLGKSNFYYSIVNGYIYISKHFEDGYGSISRYRKIIINPEGEEIINEVDTSCNIIGDFIQIIRKNNTEFLNTKNGEISSLSIEVATDKTGKIDFTKINEITTLLLEQPTYDTENPKMKKLI